MVLVRVVFHAKDGKIKQLVSNMKEATYNAPSRPRILTDLSGRMNTLVIESRHASLAAYEQWRAEFFASQEFQQSEAQFGELMEGGVNEFYTIEQE